MNLEYGARMVVIAFPGLILETDPAKKVRPRSPRFCRTPGFSLSSQHPHLPHADFLEPQSDDKTDTDKTADTFGAMQPEDCSVTSSAGSLLGPPRAHSP